MLARIKHILKEQYCIEQKIKDNDQLRRDLKLDDLDLMELSMIIEERFHIKVELDEMDKTLTVKQLVAYLNQNQTNKTCSKQEESEYVKENQFVDDWCDDYECLSLGLFKRNIEIYLSTLH